MMSMNYSNIAILKIINIDYCCAIIGIRKSEAINVLQNTDLNEKMEYCENCISRAVL